MEKRELTQISLLTAIAISVYTVESLLPTPLPWMRLGLSNAIVLLGIVGFGLRGGLLISVLRTVVGSLLVGTFLTPAFFFALSGGVSSVLLMGALWRLLPGAFSLVGISIFGAAAHNAAQLAVASALFIGRSEVLFLLPLFGFASLATGFVTGLIAHFLSIKLKFTALPRGSG
jgi:heptaprenyl diphosphate synthase